MKMCSDSKVFVLQRLVTLLTISGERRIFQWKEFSKVTSKIYSQSILWQIINLVQRHEMN